MFESFRASVEDSTLGTRRAMPKKSSSSVLPRLFIAPSAFASHFHFGCDRQLIFTAAHVDRARWLYKDSQSQSFLSCDRTTSVQLELALLNGNEQVELFDGTKANLKDRILHIDGESRPLIRSNWSYVLSSTENGSETTTLVPLNEENCSALDSGLFMMDRPVELTIDGVAHVARIDHMAINRRYFAEDVPKDDKPLKLARWTTQEIERDALSVAFTSGGDKWESDILDKLAAAGHLVHMGDLPDGAEERASDRKLSLSKFIGILSSPAQPQSSELPTASQREFIYQPGLEAPEELYKVLGLKKSHVTFSKCFPDFLELHRSGSQLEITIVDAKCTDHMKLSHRIQVAIYYFIIDALLVAHNLKDRVKVRHTGGVWLRGQNDYDSFDLAPVVAYLRDFFTRGRWRQLQETPLPQVDAQLTKKCLNCNFLNYCKSDARTHERELSLIYGVTDYEKTYIKNFLTDQKHVDAGKAETVSIEEIHDFLQQHSRSRLVPGSEDEALVSIDSEQPAAPPSTPSKSNSKIEIKAPSTPAPASSSDNQAPSTPLLTPSTSQALIDIDSMTPSKPEAPESPFPSRSNSTLEPSQMPSATQTIEGTSLDFESLDLNSMGAVKPLNRNLWLSLMKLKSFLKKKPVVLHQASTQLSPSDEMSIALTILWDRPNGHILGWSLTTRPTLGSPSSKKEAEFLQHLTSLSLPHVSVTRASGCGVHLSTILPSRVVASDPRVDLTIVTLIDALFAILAFCAAKLAKSSVRVHVFTPAETELLASILTEKAHSAEFVPSNSDSEAHDPSRITTTGAKALRLLTTLFSLAESIELPHQGALKTAASGYLHVLRASISALLALPLSFDADFDDFHAALCRPSNPTARHLSFADAHSNKGLLSTWYSKLEKKEFANDLDLEIFFTVAMAKRASMTFDMLESLRYLVTGVRIEGIPAYDAVDNVTFAPCDSLEGPSLLPLLCGPSKAFSFSNYLPTCDDGLSKLLFADSYDMWNDASKLMRARTSIAYREAFQVEDRVLAMRLVDKYEKKRPRSTVDVFVFEFEFMSESLASAIKQDIDDPKTARWLLCSNSDSGVTAALAFDDFKHSNTSSRFKFVPPGYLAFATPSDLRTSHAGKRELHLTVKQGKSMPPLRLGGTYFLSEFLLDLTSDILRTCLYGLDLRIGFMHALSKLRDGAIAYDHADKERSNKFLMTLLKQAQVIPPKPKEVSFWVSLGDFEFFNRMGGLGAFFLELAPAEEDSQRAKVKFNAVGGNMESIGASLTWAIEEYMGIQRVGTAVPLALLHDPIAWGSKVPGDFSDATPGITRSIALSELFTATGILTPAQNDILQTVLRQKLTCVWGPPGTGKTYFLANLMLLLLESHREMVEKEVEVTYGEDASKKKKPAKSTRAKKAATPAPMTEEEELALALKESLAISAPAADAKVESKDAINTAPVSSATVASDSAASKEGDDAKVVPEEKDLKQEEALPKTIIQKRIVAAGAPFSIAVVAFTHRAIDNLLERFLAADDKFRAEFGVTGGDIPRVRLPVGRAFSDAKASAKDERVDDIGSAEDLERFMAVNSQCVVGSTIWALRKYSRPSTAFNMLIVDEASQLLLSQCIVASQWLLPGGRMVVVGDHEQLPPITSIEFADDASTSTSFAKSVFEYLQVREKEAKRQGRETHLTHMLYENWRACATLNELSSDTIYASKDAAKKYRPANDAIAHRQFWMKSNPLEDQLPGLPTMFSWTKPPMAHATSAPDLKELPIPIGHPLLKLMFDASRPFGVVVLKNAPTSGVSLDSFPQAKLISCLASAVRHASAVLNPAETDESFWNSKLLIVAPHHAQRHRIRDELLNPQPSWRREWNTSVTPAIDTVEKAQGRQFEAVLVDYGIIDEYRIAKELSFLYSRNRINVSQTRAESKCIFFVSESMLKMTPQIYNSRRTADGFSYLQHLVNWARERQLVIDVQTDLVDLICRDLEDDPLFHYLHEHQPPSVVSLFAGLDLKVDVKSEVKPEPESAPAQATDETVPKLETPTAAAESDAPAVLPSKDA